MLQDASVHKASERDVDGLDLQGMDEADERGTGEMPISFHFIAMPLNNADICNVRVDLTTTVKIQEKNPIRDKCSSHIQCNSLHPFVCSSSQAFHCTSCTSCQNFFCGKTKTSVCRNVIFGSFA